MMNFLKLCIFDIVKYFLCHGYFLCYGVLLMLWRYLCYGVLVYVVVYFLT